MKTLKKTLKLSVPMGSAGLMKALVLTMFFVGLLFLNSCANLIEAARKGDTARVNALLNKGADVNAKDEKGVTVLMEASANGHTETVKALIDKGADVNTKDKDGYTALMWASKKGRIETVKALLNKGADVNAKTYEYGVTVLMQASYKGHTETVKALIDKGADINAKDKYGETALMTASEEGHTEIVKALLDKGADVNAKSKRGYTALKLASKHKHTEIVQLLRQTGEKKRERVEQDAINKLKSYLPNVTTEEKFFSDGWNSEDLFHDKVGILNMSRNRDILEVTLGFAEGVNAPEAGSDAQQLLDFATQYSKFDPNVPTNVKVNIKDRSIKLCIMRFERGLLTSVRWLK